MITTASGSGFGSITAPYGVPNPYTGPFSAIDRLVMKGGRQPVIEVEKQARVKQRVGSTRRDRGRLASTPCPSIAIFSCTGATAVPFESPVTTRCSTPRPRSPVASTAQARRAFLPKTWTRSPRACQRDGRNRPTQGPIYPIAAPSNAISCLKCFAMPTGDRGEVPTVGRQPPPNHATR